MLDPKCIYRKSIFAKCTRLACLLSFASLFVVSVSVSEKIGTGKKSRYRYRKNLVPEKVSEPVSEKFGTGKKSRNRYRKKLVPKKVPVSVSKIFGTGKKYRYRYRLKFWVPSHTAENKVIVLDFVKIYEVADF